METKIGQYLATVEQVTRNLAQLESIKQLPQYVANQLSETLEDSIQYAFVDRDSNKIYESAHIDSNVKNLLPFFLDDRFTDELNKLDWSVVDSRGVRFLFKEVFGHETELESSFLIIPKKRGDRILNFSVLWGSNKLEKADKEEVDLISAICGAAELKINGLLGGSRPDTGDRDLRRKAFELKEISGMGVDLTSLGKEDFFGSFLLNVMGRALCKTAIIFLSTNENNTQYSPVASRGVLKKYVEKINFTDKTSFIKELGKRKEGIAIPDILDILSDSEKEDLLKLEASVLIPLVSKNGLIGVLSLGERMNMKPYSERVYDSIAILSNQMVMAIENSKLSNLRYAFSRYISHQLVDGILSDPDEIKLGGERRRVAILFADIRGFTSMAEKMKPEEVVDLLNTYLSGLTDIVFKFEGTLDKYIGDCVMAVFGAPISHYNDAERATITAIEMQNYVREINARRVKEGLPEVKIGIGVNTGHVISGNMGSIDRMDYTVIGDAVNIAARLESIAGRGQILVTKEVFDEVRYVVDADFLDTINVKGRAQPVDVYEVRGLMAGKFLSVLERAEPYKVGHYLSIARDAELIGQRLEFNSDDLIKLRSTILLIDIGRIGLSEGIFNKKDKLTDQEFEIVKSHVLRGAEYVEKKLNLYKEGIELVKHHHEFYDGSGYPDGLKGEDIPLWARIVSIVESYHAMTSERPFRKALKEEQVMKILQEESGKKYDPKICDVYLDILRERKKEAADKGVPA
jgi:HD-GYP domain-containing protein (c-di-GMP phosphodiesterase class II)